MNRLLTQFGWRLFAVLAGALFAPSNASGCIWDSDTLSQERRTHPKLAEAILGGTETPPDSVSLKQRIQRLQESRREEDPVWWNELAGAHLRLGEATQAVRLLEPLLERFTTNYGIRANLGTAYHLLGRYQDAERLISRNLDRDPEAHFGLEKYHLALLQYLSRDGNYQYRHVYVDEFSGSFLQGSTRTYPSQSATFLNTNDTNAALRAKLEDELRRLPLDDKGAQQMRRNSLRGLADLDVLPAYREHWDLGGDPKLEEGVIYMASLNPLEPACFVMLGVKSLHVRDLNLAIKAYERAIQLGSRQSDLLQERIDALREHIRKARMEQLPIYLVVGLFVGAIAIYIIRKVRSQYRQRGAPLIPA